jgi:uncharacterized protein YbbC (DUF1343 family)
MTELHPSLNAVSKSLLVALTRLIEAHSVSIGLGSTETLESDEETNFVFA